ncbi:helix-turn-helix domain-containing protein [Oceanimonas baumannii]|uniref:helix-turn-helix domain-containing protein n=1 Tax=Oceanimonas baumannii TaxID=129578 RepID=UPI001D17F667|nr:helix-turn-helix transcriptional regulator [Oceanimonas baumannii]MCC4266170.1 helix-turn-helix domain-containing protein [Oceanimonas baumannii]
MRLVGRDEMADIARAERIKNTVLGYGTYEEMADKTGISTRTLMRMATAKTEPKFADVIKIAEVTGTELSWLAFGEVKEYANLEEINILQAVKTLSEESRDTVKKVIQSMTLADKVLEHMARGKP